MAARYERPCTLQDGCTCHQSTRPISRLSWVWDHGEGVWKPSDPRTMHVLIRDKDARLAGPHTESREGAPLGIASSLPTLTANSIHGEDRVRLYDQVQAPRRSTPSMRSGVRAALEQRRDHLNSAAQATRPRYTLAYRKADGTLRASALRKRRGGGVRDAGQRKNASILDYIREEVRAGSTGRGDAGFPSGWVRDASAPSALLANVWERLPQAPRSPSRSVPRSSTSATRLGDHHMPFLQHRSAQRDSRALTADLDH